MESALERWRESVDRIRHRGGCPCGQCLPYPSEGSAVAANEGLRRRGWRGLSGPIPEGWRFEEGWGLVQREGAWALGREVGDDDEGTGAVEAAPDDPWA